MSTVANVITDVRVEIDDTGSSRFSDDTTNILPVVKQAIRRANRICQRAGLHFAKKKATLTTVTSQAYLTFAEASITDIDIPIGLWNASTYEQITQKSEAEWEEMSSASTALTGWFLDLENSKILLKGTPTSAVSLSFWYFPTVDPSAYTTGSTMPWGGKLDDIISRYVAMRLQNVDEMDVKMDQEILADMENQILQAYRPQTPTVISGKGWL